MIFLLAITSLMPLDSSNPVAGQIIALSKLYQLEHLNSEIHHVAFSPDGQFLAVTTEPEVVIYQMSSGKRLHQLVNKTKTCSYLTAAFSIDSTKLMTIGTQMDRWELNDGKCLKSYNLSGGMLSVVSDDAFLLPAASGDAIVCRGLDNKSRFVLPREKRVAAIAMSPDRSSVASVGYDSKLLTIQQMNDLSRSPIIIPVIDNPKKIEMTSSNRYSVVMGGGKETVAVYNNESRQKLFDTPATVASAMNPDRFIVATSHQKSASIHELATGRLLQNVVIDVERTDIIKCMAVSADGRFVAMGLDSGRVLIYFVRANR